MINKLRFTKWLYEKLIDDGFPWDKTGFVDVSSFSKKYTLHDSCWVGMFFDVGFEASATMAFQWDSFWLPEQLQKQTPTVDDWPYLFIRINNIEQITTKNFGTETDICRAIVGLEFEEIEKKYFLAIDDVFGGQITIEFRGSVFFLAYSSDGEILQI